MVPDPKNQIGKIEMKIGYKRVSTSLQSVEGQLSGIELDKEFIEIASGTNKNRPVLKTMLEFISKGDVVYIQNISRLARDFRVCHSLMDTITGKGAVLKSVEDDLTFSQKEGRKTTTRNSITL